MADDADHPRTTSRHPSLARVYDYYLDGSLNSAIDRHLADELQAACPAIPQIATHQRGFLQRSMRQMLDLDIRQFIDLGSGLPTAGHIHHLAHAHDQNATVVYVDNDPMVVSHGTIILRSTPNVGIILADARKPTEVLHHNGLRPLIDPMKPIGITMIGVLEFIADQDNPYRLLAAYRDASRTQTTIALTMISHNNDPQRRVQFNRAAEIYRRTGAELTVRPPETINQWLAGMTILPPGITQAAQWSSASELPRTNQPDAELTLSAITMTDAS